MPVGGDVSVEVLADGVEWGWGRRSFKWTGNVRERVALNISV